MTVHDINIDTLKRLINKFIIEKNDGMFIGFAINFPLSRGVDRIYIPFYVNNTVFSKKEKEFYKTLVDLYGPDLRDIPVEEYDDFKEYLTNDLLSRTLKKLLFAGMGVDPKKTVIIIDVIE